MSIVMYEHIIFSRHPGLYHQKKIGAADEKPMSGHRQKIYTHPQILFQVFYCNTEFADYCFLLYCLFVHFELN